VLQEYAMSSSLRLFALRETDAYATRVAAVLGERLAPHEERRFEDGECKLRPLVGVRGCDVFVVQALYGEDALSVHDKLLRLLFFIATLKDASAQSVTAVLPYLCYARKDRRTKARDPLATRYVAQLLEACGVDRVVALDVHNLQAFQNAFRCPAEHLEANGLFVDHFARRVHDAPLVVVSPDAGGIKRAEHFRQSLSTRVGRDVGMAFLEKYRSAGVVSGEAVVGDVEGRIALIIDDLISTGGTLARAARACRERGARQVFAAATHGVFVGAAEQTLADAALAGVVVTDSVPAFRLADDAARAKLTVVDSAPLIAEAIRRLHEGGSLSALMAD
jgi:ribose-phosphate pyrophosphokinase